MPEQSQNAKPAGRSPSRAFSEAFRSRVFQRHMDYFSVQLDTGMVKKLYGDGNAIEISRRRTRYFFLTDGISPEAKRRMLEVVPGKFTTSEERGLLEHDFPDLYCRFIILPYNVCLEKLPGGRDNASAFMPSFLLSSNSLLWQKEAIPASPLEVQALIRLANQSHAWTVEKDAERVAECLENPSPKIPLTHPVFRLQNPNELKPSILEPVAFPINTARAILDGLVAVAREWLASGKTGKT